MSGRAPVRGATRTAGIIGWPVEHSLSPAIHNAAFAALELDWIYVPLPVPPGEAPAAVRGLRALGFAGANVTMPHKTEAADVTDTLTDDARRLRAVNTIVVDDDGIGGHNTDAPGFDRFLRRDAGFDPVGRTALIYGAGGAARATALALACSSTPSRGCPRRCASWASTRRPPRPRTWWSTRPRSDRSGSRVWGRGRW